MAPLEDPDEAEKKKVIIPLDEGALLRVSLCAWRNTTQRSFIYYITTLRPVSFF